METTTWPNADYGWTTSAISISEWDNNNSLVKENEQVLQQERIQHQLALIFGGFGLSTVALLGVVGNLLSILVLLQSHMRSSSINILLIGLQIADLLAVTGLLVHDGLSTIFIRLDLAHHYRNQYEPFLDMVTFPLHFAGETASHGFTVLVTIERYIAVCHPLKVTSLCSTRRAVLACIFTSIFSIVFTLPFILGQRVEYNEQSSTYSVASTEFADTEFSTYFFLYGIFTILYIVPFLILIILNIAIFRQYRTSVLQRKSMVSSSSNSNSEASLSVLLFSIVITFIVCNTFQLIHNTQQAFDLSTEDKYWLRYFVWPYQKFFLTVNSSSNFIFYCIFGKKFRNELCKLINVSNICGISNCCKLLDGNPHRSQGSWQNHSNMSQSTDVSVRKVDEDVSTV